MLRSTPDIDRDTWLRNAVGLCWGDRSDIRSFHARSLNGVVVATFELTFYVDPTTCRPSVLRSLITDVWARRGDRWQLPSRHSAAPPQRSGVAARYAIVPEAPPAWDVSSELSRVATSGNTSTRSMGLGGTALDPNQSLRESVVDGATYRFCSEGCQLLFTEAPRHYLGAASGAIGQPSASRS